MANEELFFSYSRTDSQFVDRFQAELENHPLIKTLRASIWVDRLRLRGAEEWPEVLKKAIEHCQVFIIFLSPHALKDSIWVKKELAFAVKLHKPILPIVVKTFDEKDIFLSIEDVQSISFKEGFTNKQYYEGKLSEVAQVVASFIRPPTSSNAASQDASEQSSPTDQTNTQNEAIVEQECNRLYRLGVQARYFNNIEESATFFQQVIALCPHFRDTEKQMSELQPLLKARKLASLREQASVVMQNAEWRRAIGILEAYLAIDPRDATIQEYLELAKVNEPGEIMYQDVEYFLQENQSPIPATAHMKSLQSRYPYFGDPKHFAEQLGLPSSLPYLQGIEHLRKQRLAQQQSRQQAAQISRKERANETRRRVFVNSISNGGLVGSLIGCYIMGNFHGGINYTHLSWWSGLGISAAGGVAIGLIGGLIGAGIDALIPTHSFWGRTFLSLSFGALLGSVTALVNSIFILKIVYDTSSDLFNTIGTWGLLIGAVSGGLIGAFGTTPDGQDGDWGAGAVGCVVGAGAGLFLGWFVAGTAITVQKGWNLFLIPDLAISSIVGLVVSIITSGIRIEPDGRSKSLFALIWTGAAVGSVTGLILAGSLWQKNVSAEETFEYGFIGLGLGTIAFGLIGAFFGLVRVLRVRS